MTLAASSPEVHRSGAPQRFSFSAWYLLPVLMVALIGFLTLVPDGIAAPIQDFVGWLLVAGMATLAVMAVVTGLDRLLDCEGN